MTWFLPSDLQSRLSDADLITLSTGEGRAAAWDDTVLQGVLDRAEAEVRGVLTGRTLLEDTDPGGLLREVTLDLAVEALYLRQKGMAAKIPEGWDSRIKRSRQLLDRIGSGEIPLPVSQALAAHRIEVLDPYHPVDGAFGVSS